MLDENLQYNEQSIPWQNLIKYAKTITLDFTLALLVGELEKYHGKVSVKSTLIFETYEDWIAFKLTWE